MHFGGIAQLVERLVRNEKARGSNPLTSSFSLRSEKKRSFSVAAQAPDQRLKLAGAILRIWLVVCGTG